MLVFSYLDGHHTWVEGISMLRPPLEDLNNNSVTHKQESMQRPNTGSYKSS